MKYHNYNRGNQTKPFIIYISSIVAFYISQVSIYADTPVKFAGITMGLKSEEIIGLFSTDEYSYIDENGKVLKERNEFDLYQNLDTVGYFEHYTEVTPGIVSHFRFTCNSFYLKPSSTNKINNPIHNFDIRSKYIYNKWEVVAPYLLFSEDNLIAFAGQLSIEKSELLDLINSLNSKYGNSKGDKKVYIWIAKNYIIKIFRYQNIMYDLNSNSSPVGSSISFQIYSIDEINNCASMVKQMYRNESDKLIQLNGNKVLLNGISLGMRKNDVYSILENNLPNAELESLDYNYCTRRYGTKYVTKNNFKIDLINKIRKSDSSGKGSFGLYDVTHSDYTKYTETVIMDNPNSMPDSFRMAVPFKDKQIQMMIYFWKDNVIRVNVVQEIYDDIAYVIKNFISNNKKYVTRYKSKPKEFPREFAVYNFNDDSLSVRTQMGGAWIWLMSRNGIISMNSDVYKTYYNILETELITLTNSLSMGSIYGWSIEHDINVYLNNNWIVTHLDLKTHIIDAEYIGYPPFIDLNTNMNMHQSYLVKPDVSTVWNMSGKILSNPSEIKSSFLRIRQLEVLAKDGKIYSISPTIGSDCIFIGKDKKSIITQILTSILNKKYGLGKEVQYLNRKSIYWKVGDNLVELIRDGKTPWIDGAQDGDYSFSIRRYDTKDIIFSSNIKKSILD